MKSHQGARRVIAGLMVAAGLAGAQPAQAQTPLDPEALTAAEAGRMIKAGKITSVQLTQLYVNRINALNKSGPGLNAVTQFNKNALVDAAAVDAKLAAGQNLGPLAGVPILVKDIVDAKGQYTSAGNYSLRNSFPIEDSGIVKNMRAKGVIILGKLGLSEFANYFGNQPSGFSNLTGQVLNANDADQNPSGSSSGSGSAGAASLAPMTIGTETNGSIIGPSGTQSLVGIRPTIGLVPPYGIAPIIASQDTAGPMVRTVEDAALLLQAIADPADPKSAAEYETVFGPGWRGTVIPNAPFGTSNVPDYASALSSSFVAGKRIGYRVNATTAGTVTPGSPLDVAIKALQAAGATVVEAPPQGAVAGNTGILQGEAHRTIDTYYAGLGPNAPIKSMEEEVADNFANPLEALKFGNATHLAVAQTDVSPGSAGETSYRQTLRDRKPLLWASLDNVLNNNTPNDTSDDFIAILGSQTNGPVAGYPQVTVPMGYTDTTRRAQSLNIYGGAYQERNIIGVASAIEQATKLRKPPSALNPSYYRCAKTIPAPPFASRGDCNPTYDEILAAIGSEKILPFALELETAQSLQNRLRNGEVTSEDLVRAYLTRIAISNAKGPATQAVRSVDVAGALAQAKALDAERAAQGPRGALSGIPVLVDESIDVAGESTTAGSIALQNTKPTADSTIVSRLKRAGAIVLGKTNVTELNGVFDPNIPAGYSSLGGQVLVPSDTDKTPAGSSAGSAAATASGLAAMTIGMETSQDSAELIEPASVAGVVGLKPTVGRVSRAGVLGVAKSQDAPGPIAKSVYDAAAALQSVAFRDAKDPATAAAPLPAPNYLGGLNANALKGKRIGVITSNTAGYAEALAAISDAGATAVTKTIGTPAPNPPSIVDREFKRDLNAYLGATPGGASSLADVIAYNTANPVEGLKYQQRRLTDDQAIDLGDAATNSAYVADRDNGQTSNRALIDGLLNNGTPADTTDDVRAVAVPVANALVGIADRAGYPVLTVPVALGTGSAGRNPIGVAMIGTAYDEAELLAEGYAIEQKAAARQAPSRTNPAMWRCVQGSDFFSPYLCHPGDLQFKQAFTPVATPVATPTATPGAYYYDITKRKRPKLSLVIKPKRDAKSPFKYKAKGKVILPKGIGKAKGCKGKVKLTLARKGKKLDSAKKSVKGNCTFTLKGSFKKSKLKKAQRKKGTVKATVKFGGNTVLKPKAKSKTVKYGPKGKKKSKK